MFDNLMFLDGISDKGDFLKINPMAESDFSNEGDEKLEHLPIVALRNTVLFPGVVIPITVGRDKSMRAVKEAYDKSQLIGVLSQKKTETEDPLPEELYPIGTVARIVKLIHTNDGSLTAILQGRYRFELEELVSDHPFLYGKVNYLGSVTFDKDDLELQALISSINDTSKQIIDLSPQIPTEAIMMLRNIDSPIFLIDFISSNLNLKVDVKQQILEETDLLKKAKNVLNLLNNELKVLELKNQIENKVKVDIEKQQRDYFLNQQLKTIQEELGDNPQMEDINKMKERAKSKNWPEKIGKAFDKEISKLQRLNPQVAEYGITLSHLELMLDLPWGEYTNDNFDLKKVREKLDEDHYGLDKIKDRIIEHLAVLKLKGDMKAPILCLVGPPGVGKTSLGKSVADAIGRKYIRMSLGGLHDESEIRGHRKTYIGAMPGRILQSLKKAKSSNPVFILDEIDKIGSDFRGDPSSALLEVLDPEQNSTFYDNYLEQEYDLSKVMFIATANTLNGIQPALRDRMEIINVSGYSQEEKLEITKRHLIPDQRKEHGLKAKNIRISDGVIKEVISKYTRESGVRNLNRQIAGLMRHAAKEIAMDNAKSVGIKIKELTDILGPGRFTNDMYKEVNVAGVAVGLAWTSVGGDILFIESSSSNGKGKLTLTGNLGDVMKESASTALSYIKSNADELGIPPKVFSEKDIHIHVPEGAIPKDGPSAGVTMLTSLVSLLTGIPVKPFLAMTGEITLRGKVLPVGGIKEKVLAAKRAGIKEIILCNKNEKNIKEIDDTYIEGLTIHYVSEMKQVIEIALEQKPEKN
ncbi:endopeptidase La [Membranihabitans maritimus]|uniref:endopeptidase La n=1 Tax=Membranihabitans maritimus TaxID=2904244 RepID=UPI001F00EC97|nr:endopeptidase La [Membranihabitans maritimus]